MTTLPNDPDRLRASMTKALHAGKNDEARAAAEQLVRLLPNDVRARLLHGDICKKLKDDAAAVDAYETAAFLYEAEGYFLKSIAVHKQVMKLEAKSQGTRGAHGLSPLYRLLGLDADAVEVMRAVAERLRALGRDADADAALAHIADDDEAVWRRLAPRIDDRSALVAGASVSRCRDAPVGQRASALVVSLSKRVAVELDVSGGEGSRPVSIGAMTWVRVGSRNVVPKGGGKYRHEPDFLTALRDVVADSMQLPSPLEAVRAAAVLGAMPLFDAEPPHVEGNAVAFRVGWVLGGPAAGPVRVRIDGETLGVTAS